MPKDNSIPPADISDYFEIQGGKPLVNQSEDGLWHIRHEYLDKERKPEVTTHISPEEREKVVLDTSRGPRLFNSAYLWNFEGKPCETQSYQAGGEGYPRNGAENK